MPQYHAVAPSTSQGTGDVAIPRDVLTFDTIASPVVEAIATLADPRSLEPARDRSMMPTAPSRLGGAFGSVP